MSAPQTIYAAECLKALFHLIQYRRIECIETKQLRLNHVRMVNNEHELKRELFSLIEM